MTETIALHFPDVSGVDVSGYRVFTRAESDGALLNPAPDTLSESGSTGLFQFTLGDDSNRVSGINYYVRIYSGLTETPSDLVFDGILYAGQTLVDKPSGSVLSALSNGTPVFGHSYLESIKRIEVASGAATLSGAGSGTEVMTSSDGSKTATFTVDASGNVSAVVWT